jgi:hypothetical protein
VGLAGLVLGETNSNLGGGVRGLPRAVVGRGGRRAFVRQVLQIEEWHTREIEPRAASVEVPVLVV